MLVERERRRGVGAEAGAPEAAGRGRLVQRPGAHPPRGARPALAGRTSRRRVARRRWSSRTRSAHLLAMEAVPQPHENWKTMLLAGRGLEHAAAVRRAARHRPSPVVGARAEIQRRSSTTAPSSSRCASSRTTATPRSQVAAAAALPRGTDRTTARTWPDARPRRLQPEERPRPRRPAGAARPRGDPLGRPGVRPRLRAHAPAEQGAPPPRTAGPRSAGPRTEFWRAYAATLGRRAVGRRPRAARGPAHARRACSPAWPAARRWSTSTTRRASASAAPCSR